MSQYRLSRQAQSDIHGIWDYIGIAMQNPAGAVRQVEILQAAFESLATQPLMGELRDHLWPNLRTFAAGNYVILYYPLEAGIEVAGVVHGAQDLESIFQQRLR